MFEIQNQTLLVAIHDAEERALAVFHGAYGSVIIALWWLDLDDFSA